MANRLFLSLSDEEFAAFESAREQLGMNRSRYVRYLISGQKEIRPPSIRYLRMIERLCDIERDLRVIAMKDSVSDADKIYIMQSIKEIKKIMDKRYTSGQIVQK